MSSTDTSQQPAKVITVQNASACTAFELRQELVKRNAFDLDEAKVSVNYRSLLQRLMIELVKDEEAAAQERQRLKELEAAEAREKAKQDREAKKQEALERSRLRREADPAYFEKRKVNELVAPINPSSDGSQSTSQEQHALIQEESSNTAAAENDDEDQDSAADPFRTYKNKSRSKIFVR